MSDIQRALADTAYALFALEQPLALAEIAEGARTGTFPGAALRTPDWFAAAAESGDLLSMAPELQALPPDGEEPVDLAGVDLIRVYAPEMIATSTSEPQVQNGGFEDVDDESRPRESTRISLLRELQNLDD